jgi:succinate dehydrogenase hydrophobic anchor subunit
MQDQQDQEFQLKSLAFQNKMLAKQTRYNRIMAMIAVILACIGIFQITKDYSIPLDGWVSLVLVLFMILATVVAGESVWKDFTEGG